MTVKSIIYGGAFNPPTVAHQAIVQSAVDYAHKNNAEFWLLLSGERADKSIQVPHEKRLVYAEGLLRSVDSNVKMRIIDFELKTKSNSQTYITYEYLKKKYPNNEFVWVFGSDSIQTMPSWKNGYSLMKNLEFLVVQRAGHTVELLDNMNILHVDTPVVSSTEVRERLLNGESVTNLVPETISVLL